MNKKSLFVCFLIGLIIFSSITACKKPEETEKDNVAPPAAKWTFIPYDFFTHKSDFYEDMLGNVSYRNAHTLYLFDEKGVLKRAESINVPKNESKNFTFRGDGSFFIKQSPYNSRGSDFIFYHKRMDPFWYSTPIMIDIRKLDTSNKYVAEYYIHDVSPNNLVNSSSNSGWIFASKYPDANALFGNKNAQPVLIYFFDHNVGQEYELPKDIFYHGVSSSSTHFCVYAPQVAKTYSFDRFGKFIGTQEKYNLIPQVDVLGSFVMRTTDGYYLSDNAIQLKEKIPGLSNEDHIFHGRDSLLHIYNNGSYSTINAITGAEVFILDTKSEKMPIDIDTVNTHDYYSTSKGVGYLITDRGIVVIN